MPGAGVVHPISFPLLVTTGSKTFILVYRHNGRPRRLTLGRYPQMPLQDAREKAHAALSAVAAGRDPQGEKRDQVRVRVAALTFADAVDAFIEAYCRRANRPSTAAETERLLRSVFIPRWASRRLKEITRDDIEEVIDAIMQRGAPSSARHAFSCIRKFFNWCLVQELVDETPCLRMQPPVKAANRDRVLNDAELGLVWRAAVTQGLPFGPIVQLLMLTGQRRGEVVGMRWDEIDKSAKLWSIPGSRSKNHKPHLVPLTSHVLAVLKAIPRIDDSPFVFPARGKPLQAYSGYSKGKRELETLADFHDWTLHDLRRSAATGMAKLGVAPHVIERILNHSTGTFAGVAGVYNRFQYLDEMRAALELWARRIEAIAGLRSAAA